MQSIFFFLILMFSVTWLSYTDGHTKQLVLLPA